jgi:hypothetical protein
MRPLPGDSMMRARNHVALATLAMGLASIALAQTAASTSGWTVTMNMTTDSGAANRRTSMAIRQQITPRYFRTEFVQLSGVSMPINMEGMYTVFDVVDSTVTTVMPAQHMAAIMSLGSLDFAKAARVAVSEQHLTRSDLEDLGDGGRLLGHPTRHYRLTTAGTVDLSIAGHTCTTRLDGTSEMWIASDVDLGPASEGALARLGISPNIGTGMGFASGTTASQNRGVAPAEMPKGTALRTIMKQMSRDANGRDVTVTNRMEIVELARSALDPSLFHAPSDMQTTDMRKMMAELPAGMLDSAMAVGASSGTDSVAKAICGRA